MPTGLDERHARGSEDDHAMRMVANELASKATMIEAFQFKVYAHSGVAATLARSQLRGHLAIQEGIADIPQQAFMFAPEITSITLPNSLVTVGEEAFYGCPKLFAVHIPDNCAQICSKAFYNTSLRTVSIPATTLLIEQTGPVFPEACTVVVRETTMD